MGGVDHDWSPAGQAYPSLKYKRATADPRYPQYFPADHPGAYASADGGFPGLQGSFCKVLQIEPGTTVKQDITVEPASTIPIKIQDATGRPLVNTFVWEEGRTSGLDDPIRTETDSWLAQGVAESGQPRRLVFYEPSKKLFATLTLKSDEKGPVVVRLRPCGVVRGTVVDGAGKPVSGVNVNLTYHNAGINIDGMCITCTRSSTVRIRLLPTPAAPSSSTRSSRASSSNFGVATQANGAAMAKGLSTRQRSSPAGPPTLESSSSLRENNHGLPSLGAVRARQQVALDFAARRSPAPPSRLRRHLGRTTARPQGRAHRERRPPAGRNSLHRTCGFCFYGPTAGRCRGRRAGDQPAQGLVVLPHAFRRRPVNRAPHPLLARSFRHRQQQGRGRWP